MKRTNAGTVAAVLVAATLTIVAVCSRPATASEPFIGQIQYFAFTYPPRGWAFCNGQLLSVAQNTALFALVGTIYGGDGRTTFGLPDMRGRGPIHAGRGPGLSDRRMGERAGAETVTLSTVQLPAHGHPLMASSGRGATPNPTGAVLAVDRRDQTYRAEAPDTSMHADSLAVVGGGQSHENMPPFLAVNCNIATIGLFPSRN